MNFCTKWPCGMTSGGCNDSLCPSKPTIPTAVPNYPYMVGPERPMGCICPPTSEQTCGNPACPRKAPAIAGPIGSLTSTERTK
jgi:hypothetical protein